jgi:hypothetical protein
MKYLLTFYGEEGEYDDATPEEMMADIARWNAFEEELRAAGAFLACEPLQPGATATTLEPSSEGERIVSDGPFIETKEQLGGFLLMECGSRDEAIEWARKVPLSDRWTFEVRETIDYDAVVAEGTESAEAARS